MLIARPDGPLRFQVYAGSIRVGFIHQHKTGGFNDGRWYWILNNIGHHEPERGYGNHVETLELAKVELRNRWLQWIAEAGLMVNPAPRAIERPKEPELAPGALPDPKRRRKG
ncbi:hypothetical protein sos41_12120 [Alphaproteobacteria bacterium SO-S41]|nr:hypothetical protein sos41_12120 [Alphaproteobacteria bacterium SO-S41]